MSRGQTERGTKVYMHQRFFFFCCKCVDMVASACYYVDMIGGNCVCLRKKGKIRFMN